MRRLPGVPLCSAIMAFLLISGGEAQMPPPPSMPEMPSESAVSSGVVVPPDGLEDSMEAARQRDPFWPVGYVPKKVKKIRETISGKPTGVVDSTIEPVRGPLWEEARRKIDFKGISLIHEKNSGAPKYLAMVGGKLVEAGNVITVKYEDRVYRWRVTGISDEGLSLQKLDVRGE